MRLHKIYLENSMPQNIQHLAAEFTEMERRIAGVSLEPDADGYGPWARMLPLVQRQDALLTELADMPVRADDDRKAVAQVLHLHYDAVPAPHRSPRELLVQRLVRDLADG